MIMNLYVLLIMLAEWYSVCLLFLFHSLPGASQTTFENRSEFGKDRQNFTVEWSRCALFICFPSSYPQHIIDDLLLTLGDLGEVDVAIVREKGPKKSQKFNPFG